MLVFGQEQLSELFLHHVFLVTNFTEDFLATTRCSRFIDTAGAQNGISSDFTETSIKVDTDHGGNSW